MREFAEVEDTELDITILGICLTEVLKMLTGKTVTLVGARNGLPSLTTE